MVLAEPLQRLLELGVRLRPGVSEADVVSAVGDHDGDESPYVALLLALAAQPDIDGQPDPESLATNVGLLDTEFVEDVDAYERPARFLAAVAGQSARLHDLRSAVDTQTEQGTLSYTVDGRQRTWDVEVNGDWADGMVLSYVLDDLVSGTGTDVAYCYPDQSLCFVVVDAEVRAPLQSLLDSPASGGG